jgi:hypothetical protein
VTRAAAAPANRNARFIGFAKGPLARWRMACVYRAIAARARG